MAYDDFEVSAACARGWRGAAEARRCPRPGDPYELRGCVVCVARGAELLAALRSFGAELLSRWRRVKALADVEALSVTKGAEKALAALKRAGARARGLGAEAARLDARSLEDEEKFEELYEALEALEREKEVPASPCDAWRGVEERHEVVVKSFGEVVPQMPLFRCCEALKRRGCRGRWRTCIACCTPWRS